MRSTSFSVLAFVFTLSAGLVGCKGADGDTCKEDDDCTTGLMCCRSGAFERGTCGVTCDVARDSGPTPQTPDSGPMSDASMMSDGAMMSDGSVESDASADAMTSDAGPGDVGVDANSETDAGPADVGPADVGPADVGPADVGPADAGPADAGPADVGPDAEAV